MLLSGIIVIGIIAITLIVSITLIIKKFFGTSGVVFSAVILGFFIGGLYIGGRVSSSEDPNSKYSYCSDYPVSDYYVNIYFFNKDTLMGTKIGAEKLYLAPYPGSSVLELFVTENNFSQIDGKILCVDASKGQLMLRTMVEGCNP
jgi:hypothetical protein